MTDVIAFPVKTGNGAKDVNLHAFFAATDAAVHACAKTISHLLQPLSDEQLVLVSERAAERGAGHSLDQIVRDLICDEFGRRNQKSDPTNYPPDGAA